MTSTRTVVKNVSFLDTETLAVNENQTIVIQHGKFSWIGDEGSFEEQDQDTIINGEGKFAIPGLFDMHVHLSYEQADLQKRGQFILRRKEEYADLLGVKHAAQYLKIGVTTVRGCGGRKSLASLRQLINEGKLLGPRLKLALSTVVQPGNQEYFGTQAMIDDLRNKEPISGKDGIIHTVRSRKADGSDHIKTTTTGGVLHGKTSDVTQSLWTDEELEAMVSEAERIGMYVAAHAHQTSGINAAVRAGVRTIEHSTILDEETIKLMLDKGTYITPTQSAGTYIYHMDNSYRQGLPPEVISKWELVSEKMVESHKLAHEQGVPLTLGTDAPVAGDHAHTNLEMQLMANHLDMSPYEVIKSGTLISAEAMKMGELLGSISLGKFGDLVLLNQDPRDNIDIFMNVENIDTVLKEGQIVSQQGKLNSNFF